jgi:hypothetical protein
MWLANFENQPPALPVPLILLKSTSAHSASYSCGETPPLRSTRGSQEHLHNTTQSLSTSPDNARSFRRVNSGFAATSLAALSHKPPRSRSIPLTRSSSSRFFRSRPESFRCQYCQCFCVYQASPRFVCCTSGVGFSYFHLHRKCDELSTVCRCHVAWFGKECFGAYDCLCCYGVYR